MSRSQSNSDRFLPTNVVVQDGLNVDDLWNRFELFEALHHTMAIASPMADGDLDRIVELLEPSAGQRVLDLACGYGELLLRMRRLAPILGVGVDLSPWMVRSASLRSPELEPSLRWVLAEARSLVTSLVSERRSASSDAAEPAHAVVGDQGWDVVCCLGASWIWYGLHGTIRALSELVEAGGLVAVGDMHIRPGCDPETVLESHGRVDSLSGIDGWFGRYGIDVVEQVSTRDDDWNAYLDRVEFAASEWDANRSADRAVRWLDEARQWRRDAERDQPVLTWSVWVGRKR